MSIINVIFPVPKAIDLTLLFEEEKTVQVKLFEFKFNAPNVNVKLPNCVRFAPSVKLRVELFSVVVVQVAPAAVVQVPVPDAESNITVSAATGAEAPLAPPVVADQLAVLLASQVPVPPTQYLVAIFYPFA